jgi:acyl transferase domain-containing protein
MVPSALVRLQALPVTANGKLDRCALPAPDAGRPELSQTYEPAVGELESRLCAVFAAVLGLDRVGRHDPFFDLGGTSLLAVRLLAAWNAAGGPPIDITTFFEHPTPAALAAGLIEPGRKGVEPRRVSGRGRARGDDGAPAIAIVAVAGRFPGAGDVDAFWQNLLQGRDTITRFRPEDLDPAIPRELREHPDYVSARGIIDAVEAFDAAFFGVPPREADLMDPQQRLFLEVAWECLERGGYEPERYPRPIGVFAGMYNATYFQHHVAQRRDLVDRVGAFPVMLANEKDYIATRVAYKLDLRGPAVSVHTACSTSLVAICQAVESLRKGECGMALAGGVSITCPPRSGYLFQDGAMLSPDGHTRTFDANAQGTVFSDGAAVVLLKRLDEAIAEGDTIHAVIRGVAVNNDGGHKASFTAPSAEGQAAVVAMALDDAGVDARSISYVEAHGTATPLGDPIEIEGLRRAFGRHTQDTGFCAIGSVKSNVGHLVIAAGATGVIKTALALERAVVPATLHYSAPNPNIDFTGSPFVVNATSRAWPVTDGPRRAGVSSFGVGGTNAHAVLEEAPQRPPSDSADGAVLLPLSARSPAALAAAARRLADHLSGHADVNLADVAWTLAAGRRAFAHRACAVAANPVEAVRALTTPAFIAGLARVRPAREADCVFLFPGQGAQYPGMGRTLAASEPVVAAALEECAGLLHAELGFDLRERLFTDDAQALLPTSITQPATFAIEYALARWWQAQGLRPAAMIGHSIGEFVAAVLAGVMPLADALRLVVRRGALMQAQPPGLMLSARTAADALQARLPAGVSLAADNGPTASVASGPADAIEAFRAALESDGIACRVLRTSHAFHSSMMDPVLAPFRAEVARATLAAPRIPIVSTRTGDWLTPEQSADPDYWTGHLRDPVRFAPALRRVLDAPARVLIEVGPRATLTTLARQQTPAGTDVVSVASLGDEPGCERGALLAAAGTLWARGAAFAPERLDRRDRRRRIPLPTYPFERQRHWVDASAATPVAVAPAGQLPASAQPASAAAVPPAVLPESSMFLPSSPASEPDRRARLVVQLKGVFEEVAGAEFGDGDTALNFVELGLDSLALTQVALQLQKTFSVKVTFRQLMVELSSLDKLADMLDQSLPADALPAETRPTPVAAPATALALPPLALPMGATSGAGSGLLQQVIAQQMQIMAQQLALLAASDGDATVAPAGAVPAAMPATPAPAAAPTPAAPAAATTAKDSAKAATVDEDGAAAHTTYDVKKAFGAIARIHTAATELTGRQHARLDAFMRRYVARTRKSKDYTQAHRAHLADPRVVNGFRPPLKEIIYQLVVERSKGPRVWDIDGNEYIDVLNGFGMNLFGWQPEFVLEAVRRQLESGYEIGPQHPLAGDVARMCCELTGFDRAGLCNTGSEAVMGTMRIARTVTGRSTIAIFTGSYHGIFDEVLVRGTRKLKAVPAAPGIMRSSAENVLVLDYGTQESLEIIRARGNELAAVLVEPVQSRRTEFQPREFLHDLRKVTQESGTVLIFDEVVTGFRAHPRGAQEVLGVDADLASYGKVVGGGFPIGVIAGKREYMDALDGGFWRFGDDSIPTVGVTYFAGTFVRHPLALAAAHAVLTHLKQEGPALQQQLNDRTTAMAAELNAFLAEVGAPVTVNHFSSVWKTHFNEDHPLQDLLFPMLRSRGVHILDNFPCFMTTSHGAAEFAAVVKAYKESILELQEADFLPRRTNAAALAFDASRPPIAGARLGRDADGKPAWFVSSPDTPGKFLKVTA